MTLAARGSALQQGSMIDHSHESSTARGGLEMGSKGHENASPEKHQRPLVEHAKTPDGDRRSTSLRRGAAPGRRRRA